MSYVSKRGEIGAGRANGGLLATTLRDNGCTYRQSSLSFYLLLSFKICYYLLLSFIISFILLLYFYLSSFVIFCYLCYLLLSFIIFYYIFIQFLLSCDFFYYIFLFFYLLLLSFLSFIMTQFNLTKKIINLLSN